MKSHNIHITVTKKRKSYIKVISNILNEIVGLKSPNLKKEIPPIHGQKIPGILCRQKKKLSPYIIIKTKKHKIKTTGVQMAARVKAQLTHAIASGYSSETFKTE